MSTSPKLLDEAFHDALADASTLDQQGITSKDMEDVFPDGAPTHVQMVQECLDFYNQHHVAMDRAIQGALNLLGTPEGVAKVNALEASSESPGDDSRSVELASELLSSGEFGLKKVTEAQDLVGFGIGVSAGASKVKGVLAGADVVFGDWDPPIGRTWVGGAVEGDLSASAGLELSFWVNKPYRGPITGWILDLNLLRFATGYYIRFMYIREPPIGLKTTRFSAVSLQFPLGIGLPLWFYKMYHGKLPTFRAKFIAWQHAARRSSWATGFNVVNKTGGTNTVTALQGTTLTCTVTNTSSVDIPLDTSTTMTLVMPSYFTAADVANMSVSLQGWKVSISNNNISLTPTSNITLDAGATITFFINNVSPSTTPASDESSTLGKVMFFLTNPSYDLPLTNSCELDLVWPPTTLYLVWKANLMPDFSTSDPTSGSTEVTATPSKLVQPLLTAVQTPPGDTWLAGYLFNYTSGSNPIPQVWAAWYDTNTGQLLTFNSATSSGQTTFCGNTDGSSISITVTFD